MAYRKPERMSKEVFGAHLRPAPGGNLRERVYIDGRWIAATGSGVSRVTDCTTELQLGQTPMCSAADVDAAVRAAAAAFPAWARTTPAERAGCLRAIRDALAARSEELAALIAAEVGTPLRIARRVQVGLPLVVLESYAGLVSDYPFEEVVGNSAVIREAAGVVAAICPWNYPLHQAVAKVAAALAAGCTVVLKPSQVAPLSAFVLAEAIDAAGLPAGAFNLVTGPGREVGEALALHPLVDVVSFTGSTEGGRRVAELGARSIKKVLLELGGKSASVLLGDADLAKAVSATVNSAFLNSGQTCNALTRLVVPRAWQEDAAGMAAAAAGKLTLGDPFLEETRLGPLVSDEQRRSVVAQIRQGMADGARLVAGGPRQPEALRAGYFVEPTVFTDVAPGMPIAQDEIFGPVLSIIGYDDEAEALEIANGTPYGLAGAVWSGDTNHARDFARGMRCGQVDINGGRFNPLAPIGGFRQSGIGRELGRHGLEEFLELKALQS